MRTGSAKLGYAAMLEQFGPTEVVDYAVAAEQAGEWLRLLTPLGELAAMARLESPGWYHPEVVLYEAVPEGS